MFHIRTTRAAAITASLLLSTSIGLGACSSKDEGASAKSSAPAAALGLKGTSDKVFSKHFNVPSRKVSDAEAKQALALLGLLESSGGAMSWDGTSGKDGTYSYDGLTVKEGTSSLNIKNANLVGVHMVGEAASFDRADFSGITIIDTEDDVTVTMDTLSIARPTPDMARAILDGLRNVNGVDDLDLDTGEGDMGFGGLGMSGVNITSDDFNMKTQTLIWGDDEATGLADFKIEDVSFNGPDKTGGTFSGSLDSFTGTGIKSDTLKQLSSNPQSPMGIMGMNGFNPLAKSYDTMQMSGFNFDSSAVTVDLKGFEGTAKEKGGVTTLRQTSEPLIIKLKEAPKDPSAKRAFDTLKTLEFDELVFQSSRTTIMDTNTDTMEVKDGVFTMKDGFELSYNYGASGVKAMTDSLQGANSTGSSAQMMASMENLTLSGFDMSLKDDSIVDRSIKLAAQMRGGTPESIRAELKMGLALAPMMVGGGLQGEMATEMATAFGSFIENGGTFTIAMNPKTPIAISELSSLKGTNMTLKDLGFSAKTE